MSWFERIVPSRIKTERRTRSVPEGLWTKCPACDAVLYRAEIERNLHVCPKCSHHMRINGRERLLKFLDTGSTKEIAAKVEPEDPLKFKDSKRYKDRIVQAQKQTGERDALIVMSGQLAGLDIVACAFEFRFLGGSMGSVVGEKFVRAVEHCLEHRTPLVCFSASGGARMQEALYSLLQMAKTSAALKRLSEARLPFISVMTDPTTGGVSASLAMLGRHQHRRTEGADRLRRSASDSTNRARDFARGFPAQRVSARARRARYDRRPARAARSNRRHVATVDRQRARGGLGLKAMRSLEQWLAHQAQVHPQSIDLGLERLERVLERLDWRQPSVPVITVAGTNGKGSVVAYCAAILTAAGYRVGTFTSPHLRDYRERIRLCGAKVTDEALVGAFERIEAARWARPPPYR